MSNKTIRLKIYSNRFEADRAKSLLEEHGIESMVQIDDCGGMRPDIGMTTGGVSLYVLEKDAEKAMQILSLKNDS
jgi:hypothetical protein